MSRRGNTEHKAPSKVRSKRSVAEAREEAALALRVKGYTERSIASELGMSPSSVHEALIRALGKRKLLTDEELLAQKHEHTMILEHKLEELILAWEKSKGDAHMERVAEKTTQAQGAEEGPVIELTVTTTTTSQCGDPRYLAEIRACLSDIRRIWGTDAPTKQELTGKDGGPVNVVFTESLARVYGGEQ